ncbi:MAG: hypothetical protein Kow0092_08990 [Deferrisomatales bacterium]
MAPLGFEAGAIAAAADPGLCECRDLQRLLTLTRRWRPPLGTELAWSGRLPPNPYPPRRFPDEPPDSLRQPGGALPAALKKPPRGVDP